MGVGWRENGERERAGERGGEEQEWREREGVWGVEDSDSRREVSGDYPVRVRGERARERERVSDRAREEEGELERGAG